MAPQLDTLPTEVLHNIFQRVRNSSNKSELEDFISLQTTSRIFRDIAQPILWIDVVLDNDSLPLFLEQRDSSNLSFIRSLTILISPFATRDDPQRMPPGIRGPYKYRGDRNVPTTKIVWKRLQTLAKALPAMIRLNNFSFRIQESRIEFPDTNTWLQPGVIKDLIENLNPTCTGLEIDTANLEQECCKKVHLYDTIRGILPRMKHVRLRLGQLCESIMISDITKASTQVFNNTHLLNPMTALSQSTTSEVRSYDATVYVLAPLLETLVVDLTRTPSTSRSSSDCSRCETLYTPKKGLLKSYSFDRESYAAPFIGDAIISALKAQALPSVTTLSVLGVIPFKPANGNWGSVPEPHRLHFHDYLVWNLCKLDLLKEQYVRMPYFFAESRPESDFVRVLTDQGRRTMGFFGNWKTLKSKSEGGVWETTLIGCRLPGKNARADAEDKGYVFQGRAVSLLDKGAELQTLTEHLRGDFEGPDCFTNGVAQCGQGTVGKWLKNVLFKDGNLQELYPIR